MSIPHQIYVLDWERFHEEYFNPETAEDGDTVDYRDEADWTCDMIWGEAEDCLSKRGLCLIDNWGDGYVVTAKVSHYSD